MQVTHCQCGLHQSAARRRRSSAAQKAPDVASSADALRSSSAEFALDASLRVQCRGQRARAYIVYHGCVYVNHTVYVSCALTMCTTCCNWAQPKCLCLELTLPPAARARRGAMPAERCGPGRRRSRSQARDTTGPSPMEAGGIGVRSSYRHLESADEPTELDDWVLTPWRTDARRP